MYNISKGTVILEGCYISHVKNVSVHTFFSVRGAALLAAVSPIAGSPIDGRVTPFKTTLLTEGIATFVEVFHMSKDYETRYGGAIFNSSMYKVK